MQIISAAAVILCFVSASNSMAGEVAKVCANRNFPVLELEFRKGEQNFKQIKAANLGTSPAAIYLKKWYSEKNGPLSEAQTVPFVFEGNQKFIPNSALKEKFLKFATTKQRLADPSGYRATLIELFSKFFPDDPMGLNWLLNLKDPLLASTALRPASSGETGNFYGAVSRIRPAGPGKFSNEIIVSNNESEPIPYLMSLLAHELYHASTYADRIKVYGNERATGDMLIVQEAKAFDTQMQAYLKLAKQNPEIFCDWMYDTWAYGDIPIPLSWSLASMEKAMLGGKYIYDYAKSEGYKDKTFLLNADGSDLRADLKEKIKKMNLVFVK